MRRAVYQTLLWAPFRIGSAGIGIAGFIGSVWPEKVRAVIGGDTVTIQGVSIALLAIAAVYFALLWLLKPSQRDEGGTGGPTVTTHGPHSPGIGSVGGNVTQNFYVPPGPKEEPKQGGFLAGDLRLQGRAERAKAAAPVVYPDMALAGLVERAKLRYGRNANESDQDLDHFILDGVVNRRLHTWGRIKAGKPVTPIRQEAWERGDFSHVRGTLRYRPDVNRREVVEWTDIQFNYAEVKRWFRPDLGPNGWMAGDV